MKKDVNGLLPINESDDPDDIIKKDKKDLTVLLISGLIALSLVILTAFIAFLVLNLAGIAFISVFFGAFLVISFIVCVKRAHNDSRRTVALMKLTEVVTGENPIPDELLLQVIENRKAKSSADNDEKTEGDKKAD